MGESPEKHSALVAALLGEMPLPVRPFDPSRDGPADLGLGGLSTEVLMSVTTPQGDFANIPSAWFLGDQGPFLVDDPTAFASDYEMGTGNAFPRFDSLDQAVSSAEMRSASGGATSRPLTEFGASLFSRDPLFGLGFE